MMCKLDLSRIVSKWRVIAPAIFVCAANVYADCADCEAYKAQVASDCDAIISIFQNDFSQRYVSLQAISTSLNNQGHTSEGASIERDVTTLQYLSSSIASYVSSIKSTAQSLQCSTNSSGSCDCALYLQSLVTLVTSAKNELEGISATLGTIEGETVISELDLIERTNQDLVDILTQFFLWDGGDSLSISIMDLYSSITNLCDISSRIYLARRSSDEASLNAFTSKFWYNNINNTLAQAQLESGYNNLQKLSALTLGTSIKGGFTNLSRLLASLNNYSYTNLFQYSSILYSLDDIKFALTNRPAVDVWGYVQEVDRSPLDRVSSQYYTYLTNEYLSTWSANDNPNTNWFRRVEILLASMVFRDSGHQDELDEIEEGLPSSSDLSSLENSLDASDLFDVDIGGQFFDGAPTLPEFGSQLPQTLVITIPSFGGDNSQSASSAHTIDIDVNSISSLCDAVRACFRFLWWGLVALLVFFLGRWFLRGCSLAFKLIQGIHFS